ncbi:MAG TPA: DNA adenine methylase [Dehalococcoidia bacterium]|nr:DNA adenine methylase [Dehalococcoidia bacterium]
MRTGEYLYHQLIPYLGNKRRLLPWLAEALGRTGQVRGATFLDLFAGSGVVSRLAKSLGFRVIANDWEPFSFWLNQAAIGLNRPPAFDRLDGAERVFDHLNRLPPVDGYLARHYCPEDDGAPDPDRERLFFTRANGRRLDAMREQIAEWEAAGVIDEAEKAYVLAPLLFTTSYVSNTSGVFKAFHRGWGGQTGTAHYRILSRATLRPPVLRDNAQFNRVHQADAAAIAGRAWADIVYLDPPYNQHQYGSNYHLLNTLALWDKPPLSPRHEPGRRGQKSAIRLDWRADRRSAYCSRRTAPEALAGLLDQIDARHIILSYSSEGLIPAEQLLGILSQHGRLQVLTRPYKRYRVSSQRYSARAHTQEIVVIVSR